MQSWLLRTMPYFVSWENLIVYVQIVLVNLAEKLIATEFGDMLPQNIFEIYQIMFNNVFEVRANQFE